MYIGMEFGLVWLVMATKSCGFWGMAPYSDRRSRSSIFCVCFMVRGSVSRSICVLVGHL